ncbi:MAG: type II toxin-antitoxin system PemK/MazF family toxin [Ardenticatenales bacterium]
MIRQGEVYIADLPVPTGSEPGYVRPIVVIQSDRYNASAIRTVLCVAVTTNLTRLQVPGNVLLGTVESGLAEDSVVNVAQVVTLDKQRLIRRVGWLASETLDDVLEGVRGVIERVRFPGPPSQ